MRAHTSATTEENGEFGTKGAHVGGQLFGLDMTYPPVPPYRLCRLVYLYCPRVPADLIKTIKPRKKLNTRGSRGYRTFVKLEVYDH